MSLHAAVFIAAIALTNGLAASAEENPKPAPADAVQAKPKDGSDEAAKAKAAKELQDAVNNRVQQLQQEVGNIIRFMQAPAPQPRPAFNRQAAPNDAVVQQVQQQYQRHFEQILKGELHLVRLILEPPQEDFERIRADAKESLKDVMRNFALSQTRMRGRPVAVPTSDAYDPREALAEAICESIEQRLSADHARRYQDEIALRAEAIKHASIMGMIAILDASLIFSDEQRKKLFDILSENWNDSWASLYIYLNQPQYLPRIPEEKLLPILNDDQRKVWQNSFHQRGTMIGTHELHMMPLVELGEEAWDDDANAKAEAQE